MSDLIPKRRKPRVPQSRPEWAVRMAKRRKDLGVSQVGIAKMLNLSQSAYGDYETGRSEPSIAMFEAIGNLLECDASWIVFGVGKLDTLENNSTNDSFFVLRDMREADPVFKEISMGVESLFDRFGIFFGDGDLIIVITQKLIEHRAKHIRHSWFSDLNMFVERSVVCLERCIKEGLSITRIRLLSDPNSYLPPNSMNKFTTERGYYRK